MQAIVTKYLGPTNYRGSRVKATCQAGSLILPWDDALDVEANHDMAASALRTKLGWDLNVHGERAGTRKMCRGALPDNTGNVYVFCAEKI